MTSLSIDNSRSLFKLIESVIPFNHLIFCCTLLLPSIFPSIRVFSNESALHIRWPKYCRLSFSINTSNGYSGLFTFRIDFFHLLAVQATPVFSTITQKYQFFSAQPSLWSNPHSHTWLLEKLCLWLHGTLSAKWCLCFVLCCLVLS